MKKKTLALVSHDGKKSELIEWINYSDNIEKLKCFNLVGTRSTSALIKKILGLDVTVLEPIEFASGPLGGDLLISVEILKGNIDALIFFTDPLDTHPHQSDIHSLQRAVVLKNIPTAPNKATADMLITSYLLIDSEGCK